MTMFAFCSKLVKSCKSRPGDPPLDRTRHRLSADDPRDRSIAARRAARRQRFERERLIVDCLNRRVSAAEIAERIGVTEKRMRALVKEILARRMPQAPQAFIALRASRLNEALLVAYGAMSDKNLEAVALVVRNVRALDRRHGFVAAGRRALRGLDPDAEAQEAPCGMQASPFETGGGAETKADAGRSPLPRPAAKEPAPPPANGPEVAPQCVGRPARSRR